MADAKENDQTISPFDLDAWTQEAIRIAIDQKFKGDEIDAFRHTYVNAMITWRYGLAAGIAYADGLGITYEAAGLAWTIVHDAGAAILSSFGIEITPYDIGDQVRSSVMDIYNNNIGVAIGSTATSKEDIISKVANAVRSGLVITSPEPLPAPSSLNDNFMNSFAEGEWGGMGGMKPAGGVDPTRLLDALFKKKGGGKSASTGQIVLTSVAALARELAKSRQRSLEEGILNVLTGGRKKNYDNMFAGMPPSQRPPFVIDENPQSGGSFFSAALDSVLGAMVSNLFQRESRRSESGETPRSREALSAWQQSRSQQQAYLAQMVQRGMRNL